METDIHFARLLADLPEALVCDEAFLGELAKNAKLISVKKGDYLLRTGELCQDAYFINKGLFINLYVNENGNECVTGFAADNSFRYPLFASYYQNIMLTIIYKLDVLLAVRLSSTAEEFIQFLYTNYAWMINRVPDKYIAHYMGISNAWYCKLKRKVLSFTRTE